MGNKIVEIASAFTTVRGPLIKETYAAFVAWDFLLSKEENFEQLRKVKFIQGKSKDWLNYTTYVINQRFDPSGRDRALVLLAKSGCSLEEWKPLLLWHMTSDEFLIKDFLTNWLFPTCYETDAYQVHYEDVHTYLLDIAKRELRWKKVWATATSHRVSLALLRIAADFGLLEGKNKRQFVSYNMPERSFIYLLHILIDRYKNPKKVIEAKDWRLFLLRPSDVEKEILRLHDAGQLTCQFEGKLINFFLPCQNADEYANAMIAPTPGERCELDYATEKIPWLDPKTGDVRNAHVFVGVLVFSQMTFAWTSEDDSNSNWLQAHHKMFDAIGGVPHLIISGCPKESLIKSNPNDPEIRPGCDEIASHYATKIVAAREKYSQDLTLVSVSIKIIMRVFRLIYRRHTFASVAEINYALGHVVHRMNCKSHSKIKSPRVELWASQEKHALKSLPTVAFEAVRWNKAKVHSDCTVSLESAYYSVPYAHRGKQVRIKRTPTDIEIFVGPESVATHKRDFARRADRYIFPEHLPDNETVYAESLSQKILFQASLITESLHDVVRDLFKKDTLGNLRRAQRMIGRSNLEIKEYGRETAVKRIREIVEQMQRNNNFGSHYFETNLIHLRQQAVSGHSAKVRGEIQTLPDWRAGQIPKIPMEKASLLCMTATSAP